MSQWYEEKKNVIELAEFMVESEQILTARELLEYFKFPMKYTKVWELYLEEIVGKQKPISECKYKNVPELVALIKPSSICE